MRHIRLFSLCHPQVQTRKKKLRKKKRILTCVLGQLEKPNILSSVNQVRSKSQLATPENPEAEAETMLNSSPPPLLASIPHLLPAFRDRRAVVSQYLI